MCNLYSITTNQAAIIALFRVVNRYVGNRAPMPGVFPDYPAPVVRNTDVGTMMRWGMPPPPRTRRPTRHKHPQHVVAALARLAQTGEPLLGPGHSQTQRLRKKMWCGSHLMMTDRSSPSLASGRRLTVIAARSRSRCRGRIRSMSFVKKPN